MSGDACNEAMARYDTPTASGVTIPVERHAWAPCHAAANMKYRQIVEGRCPDCGGALERQAICGWCPSCRSGWSYQGSGWIR